MATPTPMGGMSAEGFKMMGTPDREGIGEKGSFKMANGRERETTFQELAE